MKRYVEKRFNLKGEEAELLKEFLFTMMTLPQGSDEAIHYILKPPSLLAYIPLEEHIAQDIKIPVDCFFGESDYMDTTGARRIDHKQVKKNFSFKTIPKAAHQLTMQNPKVLAQQIILGVKA